MVWVVWVGGGMALPAIWVAGRLIVIGAPKDCTGCIGCCPNDVICGGATVGLGAGLLWGPAGTAGAGLARFMRGLIGGIEPPPADIFSCFLFVEGSGMSMSGVLGSALG